MRHIWLERNIGRIIVILTGLFILNVGVNANSLYEEGNDVSITIYAIKSARSPCALVVQYQYFDIWIFYQLGQYDGFRKHGYYPVIDGRVQSEVPFYRLREITQYCKPESRGTLV